MNGLVRSLRAGRVTGQWTTGESMSPAIRRGQRQILVPVLPAAEEAARLGAAPFDPGRPCGEGELRYVTPEDLRVGDAVYCRVGRSFFTHEIVGIRGEPGGREFLIARHDRRRVNGWTALVYGKCVRVEDP